MRLLLNISGLCLIFFVLSNMLGFCKVFLRLCMICWGFVLSVGALHCLLGLCIVFWGFVKSFGVSAPQAIPPSPPIPSPPGPHGGGGGGPRRCGRLPPQAPRRAALPVCIGYSGDIVYVVYNSWTMYTVTHCLQCTQCLIFLRCAQNTHCIQHTPCIHRTRIV